MNRASAGASENVVILGATSGIARPLCRVMAARGCRLVLAGRDATELERMAEDLRLRYEVKVAVESFDAVQFEEHPQFVQRCLELLDGELTGVVYCAGYLTDQQQTQEEFAAARRTLDVNFSAAVSLLHGFANRLEEQRGGYLAAISSVAGDRGRQSNYTYGAAKAGLNVFLEGLRHRLFAAGVQVINFKPGPVDTPMIDGRMDPESWQVASAESVAKRMDWGIRKRKAVVYVPGYWWWVMGVIRWLPEWVFKRTRL